MRSTTLLLVLVLASACRKEPEPTPVERACVAAHDELRSSRHASAPAEPKFLPACRALSLEAARCMAPSARVADPAACARFDADVTRLDARSPSELQCALSLEAFVKERAMFGSGYTPDERASFLRRCSTVSPEAAKCLDPNYLRANADACKLVADELNAMPR